MLISWGFDMKYVWRNITWIAYWMFTFLVVFEMMAGGIWDLMHIEYVRVVLTRLGYPIYLLTILGIWKIPCAMVLLVPRFQRLKEWAYAGAIFNYTGAAASHYLTGYGGARGLAGPLLLASFTLASWAFRPQARRLSAPEPSNDHRLAPWLVPILVLIVLSIISFLTLPKGGPPF
jgi:hypothetical protein